MDTTKTDPCQTAIDSLLKLAQDAGITETSFEEEVIAKKKFEAQQINRAGMRRQIEYIMSEYGTLHTEQGIDRIERIIIDNARRGKTVECSDCGEIEFLSRAHVHNRQQYCCQRCHKAKTQ